MKLPENLKRIRRENNLSQEQLAEKIGVSRQAVSKWESGQSYPEMDKMLLICKLFNYNIDDLMNENVMEVSQNKQSKTNINKYIEDFFGFINKTIDMFSAMRFRDKLKCLLENVLMCVVVLTIFLVLSAIGGHIFANAFGFLPYNAFRIIKNILESFFTILYLIITVTILLHIFKVRYLDYYEIIKVDKENVEENKKEIELEKGKKIFVEKNKEKIIIRDPNHSESKFLTGIAKIVFGCIKFIAAFIGIGFAFTFIGLITLLILSFLFIKTGIMFIGVFLGLIAAIIINFLILEEFYNFIISKKTNRTKRAIMFIISLVIVGISIGLICIGITQFNLVEDINGNNIEKVYEIKMKDNLAFNVYGSVIEYVETDSSDKVKIVVNHSKYYNVQFLENNKTRNSVHCFRDNTKVVEFIRDIIKDVNNKELKDYSIPVTYVYTSKVNIQKILKNN